ncbi:MAG: pyridoxal-phosphate-dependent aminotransferase family protein [Promethearchaeota archaeon]
MIDRTFMELFYAMPSHIHSITMVDTKIKLFTPGPVYVAPDTLAEFGKECDTHRSKWYADMHQRCVENLKKVMFTSNDIFLGAFTGSGFMEACVANTLDKDEKGLFIKVGAFGERWASMARGLGKNHDVLEFEWGTAAKPEKVKEALEGKNYTTVFIQFNETSTGIRNPLEEIAPIIKDSGALLCVDAVSGLGGMKLEVDKLKIDACLASTQKCFAVPPGLSICSVSGDLIEKARNTTNRGYYLDLLEIKKYADKHNTPTTVPVPQVRALEYKVNKMVNEEGIENVFKRHRDMAKATQDWATGNGFELFSEEGYRSWTVTTISNNKNINAAKLVATLESKGYRIVNGYKNLKGKTFRIGHMGDLNVSDLEELFVVMDETLAEI